MNRTVIIMFLTWVILSATACREEFEKTYDLRVDSYEYSLPAEGKQFHIYVYCSADWTAEFETEQDWLTMVPGTESGSGIGIVRLTAEYNDVEPRSVNLILKSGALTQTVLIRQKYDSTHWEIK